MFDADVIVVGSGTGGLAAARRLRQAGHTVMVLEKKSLQKAAHTWVNGCEPDIFQRVFGRPAFPHELHESPKTTYLTSPGGYVLEAEKMVYGVRMDAIRQSLLEDCLALGVEFKENVSARALLLEEEKVAGIDTSLGELKSRLLIDASGYESGLRKGIQKPPFQRTCPRNDLCLAYDASHHLDYSKTDPKYAPDSAVSTLSAHGIYSVLKVQVSKDTKEASFLIGIMADHHENLWDILSRCQEQMGGVGERIFGGGGKIPLSHHLSSFVWDGYAVIGDAAFMVNAQHGSGTASSLLAGHLAAEAGSAGLDGDDGIVSRDALWAYNVNYMKERGAIMIQQQLMRLFTVALKPSEVDGMFKEKIITREDLEASIKATNLDINMGRTLRRIRGLTLYPAMATLMGKMAPLIGVLTMMHRAYPGRAWEYDWGGWPGMYNRLMANARSLPFPGE